ncbi:MAG: peptidoglycan-binding protein [Patescibacteria group bacterium]
MLSVSGDMTNIIDATDGSSLWVSSVDIEPVTSSESTKATEITNKTTRASKIVEVVGHYYIDDTITPGLYSANEAGFEFANFISGSNFPRELVLALFAHESGGSLDNELVTYDYGHGLAQATVLPKLLDVTYLQTILTFSGQFSGPINGLYGPTTESAVTAYQTAKSITPADGRLRPATRASLNSLLNTNRSSLSSIPSNFLFEEYFYRGRNDVLGNYDNRGVYSGIEIPPCDDISTPLASSGIKHCYQHKVGSGNLEYKEESPQPNFGNIKLRYYDNSPQSIYANIKDGLGILKGKYTIFESKVDKSTKPRPWAISTDTSINDSTLKILLAVRGYNGFGKGCYAFNNENNPKYQVWVADKLGSLATIYPSYTGEVNANIGKQLALSVEKRTEICVMSPVYLSIYDQDNNQSGGPVGTLTDNIPEVVYDNNAHKEASILFPRGTYRYRVTGIANDGYSIIVQNFDGSINPTEFVATNIPIKQGEVHEYTADWQALAKGENGMTIQVDSSGDGIFELKFKSDLVLTASEYAKSIGKSNKNKVTICHIPPGNPANAHSIAIGADAVKAHLAHGDTQGACGETVTSTPSTTTKIKKKK